MDLRYSFEPEIVPNNILNLESEPGSDFVFDPFPKMRLVQSNPPPPSPVYKLVFAPETDFSYLYQGPWLFFFSRGKGLVTLLWGTETKTSYFVIIHLFHRLIISFFCVGGALVAAILTDKFIIW